MLFRQAMETSNKHSISAIERLAVQQEQKARELLQQVKEAFSESIVKEKETGALNLPPISAPQPRPVPPKHHVATPSAGISVVDTEFTWEEFWASVDGLLDILPNPMAEEEHEDTWVKVRAPDVLERSQSPNVDEFIMINLETESTDPPEFQSLRESAGNTKTVNSKAYNTLVEELRRKNKENIVLKKQLEEIRQQLKFKVSRLRQFEGMPPFTNIATSSIQKGDTDYSQLLRKKDDQIAELQRQVEDRNKFIADQSKRLEKLETRWEDLKQSAKLKKSKVDH